MPYQQFGGWNIVPMPASPAPRQITFTAQDSVGQTQSPFTLQSQIQAWPGADWWELDVSLPPMSQQRAKNWIAWLMAMRGKANVFQIGDPLGRLAAGEATGTPLINGAQAATAMTISTKGWVFNPAANNLVPDPDLMTTWTITGPGLVLGYGAGDVSGNGFVYYGGAPSAYAYSPTFTVATAGTYVISGFIDATTMTSGAPYWGVHSSDDKTVYGNAIIQPGFKGRVSIQVTLPANTSIHVVCDVYSATVRKGTPLTFANPKLEANAFATAYGSLAQLLPGDYLQIGYRLHVVSGPSGVYPDTNGNASIEIWPSLREAQPDGTPVQIVNPSGLFRLADNKRAWSVTETKLYGLSFKAVEAR